MTKLNVPIEWENTPTRLKRRERSNVGRRRNRAAMGVSSGVSYPADAFVLEYNLTSGTDARFVNLPIYYGPVYIDVDWGDGESGSISYSGSGYYGAYHYHAGGAPYGQEKHIVQMTGYVYQIGHDNSGSGYRGAPYLRDVLQWGSGGFTYEEKLSLHSSGITKCSATDIFPGGYMEDLFSGCPDLVSVAAFGQGAPWDSGYYMFDGCSSLESVDASRWDATNATLNLRGMFTDCSSLLASGVTLPDMTGTNITSMYGLCWGATLLDLDISIFQVALNMSYADRMMEDSAFSDANYDKALLAWSQQNGGVLQTSVIVHFGTAQYTETAARAILTNAPNLWTITDGGPVI